MSNKTARSRTGKTSSYRRAMYRNLVTDLLGYEKITTTAPKAAQVRGLAEKMITLGKRGGLHSRRQALSFVFNEDIADKLFNELAQRYSARPGGYTRITKLGPRLGDGALMVQLELVK
ncbi:MAG: 50S ribosomal protein L17 [Dehalococcoidales bacterium]|nr:50S ribosomal protein L17 [Dehalococcoidales bacterium]MDZ4230800.1 50S ribosomal protein L17 [Dehalococcoidales bacterium]